METLELMNYARERCDTGIRLEDVEALRILVITGDEIATVVKTDGTQETFDSADLTDVTRCEDYFDGEYGVHKDDLAEWSQRESTYDWFGRMLKDAEV